MKTLLEIISTSTANDYTSTAIASTVTSAVYRANGTEETITAKEGCALVLVVDGVQKNLLAGASYEVEKNFSITPVKIYRIGGPSAAPWSGAKEEEKATYYFRQALLVNNGAIISDGSVTDAITGGTYTETSAEGITINAGGAHFNGILLDNGTKYEIKNSRFYAYGDGGDDLAGWGTSIMADNKSLLDLKSTYIETAGAIRCALYVDNTSIANVTDTVIYTKETPDTYEEYKNLVPAMMKRVPFALGMEGTVRSLNVMADGQGRFKDCIIVSTGWGAISTDSGTAYDVCKTYALDVEDTLSGIGTLEVAQEGKSYTAARKINGVTYGFTVGGSGYVTYADSGVHNRYKNVEFYSPDYIQVMGSGRTGSSYIDSYLQSGHTAFMTQQTGGGTFDFTNTTIDTVDALLQIKSGAANTGFSNIILDQSTVNFSGTSTRCKDGILVELVESDDAGNPGITTYTINDHAEEAEATSSTVSDCNADLRNGSYNGDIYNCIYNYKQVLNVSLEHASLKGRISSSTAVHVDLNGDIVPNGTVLNAFMGSEEYNHADYSAKNGGQTGDCLIIGRFCHTAAPILNNPINVTLKDSSWKITGDGYIHTLTTDSLADLWADTPVTVYVKALNIGEISYADGTYKEGNVTVVVDSAEVIAADNGIADAGQTYGNVTYTFYAANEGGEPDSKAITLKRQNYIDGNLYFTMIPSEGYEILSVLAEGGSIIENTAGGELSAYKSALCPAEGASSMKVCVTVKH
ncbi:Uncharacterised protein [uncultured Roseburia sp.]|uniref:Uncharacterized protein n=1 Tax=Brotonthovivens ammoniilytica TaxID=2981725 RepID=A0ABT2TIQ2_9FIRM|nr:hypothetical protein [Brotonthovivens ammoniilytica]MCU6762060.1 hypothetical protein [Brotonthovivens ammoniilytica]SCI54448.1 Uncharacterised protein [uncultured Roseburia sp.]